MLSLCGRHTPSDSRPYTLSPAPPLRWRNPSRLSLAIVPRPCLALVTVCKGPVRIRSRARLRRSGKNCRRQRRLIALRPLPRVQISSLLRLHLGLMEISTALLWLASSPLALQNHPPLTYCLGA